MLYGVAVYQEIVTVAPPPLPLLFLPLALRVSVAFLHDGTQIIIAARTPLRRSVAFLHEGAQIIIAARTPLVQSLDESWACTDVRGAYSSGADARAPGQVNQLTGYLVSLGAFAVHPHAPPFPPPATLQ